VSLRRIALVVAGACGTRAASAQTAYYSLDTGRPTRVDDAAPTERYSLELVLAPFRAEAYPDGLKRFRFEPKVSYGLLPRTEIEVRVPVMRVQPRDGGSVPRTGITSVGIGGSHELTLEGRRLPAFAIGGEWLIPAGSMAPPSSSYALKAMATKTFPLVRIHFNAGIGSYSVQPMSSPACVQRPSGFFFPQAGVVYCDDGPSIVDLPCSASREGDTVSATAVVTAAPATSSPTGRRTFAGLAVDHTFARQSTLVVADVVSDKLDLYPLAAVTVELGVRHQVTPWLVLDAGLSRTLRGAVQYTGATVGATYDLPVKPELCAP
jgi:hypothetical protein